MVATCEVASWTRVAASSWFGYINGLLQKSSLENFPQVPTLYRGVGRRTGVCLHVDDLVISAEKDSRQRVAEADVQFQLPAHFGKLERDSKYLKRMFEFVPEAFW